MNSCCGSLRRVAVGLDAEPPPDDVGVVAEQRVDLVVAPEVERAFRLVRAGVVRVLGRHAVGVLGRVEAAAASVISRST